MRFRPLLAQFATPALSLLRGHMGFQATETHSRGNCLWDAYESHSNILGEN